MTKSELFRIRVKKAYHSFRLLMIFSGYKRADYIKKHGLFKHVGDHCYWHPKRIPQDAKWISLGDNVFIAANVSFIAHDQSDSLLNYMNHCEIRRYQFFQSEIKIGSNVLVGSRTIFLPGKTVGNNCVIGAGTVVSQDIPDNSVAGGNPVRIIGSFDDFAKKRRRYSKEQL